MSTEREKLRKEILRVWSENKESSYSSIAKTVKSSKNTVRNVVKRFVDHQRVDDLPRSGRPTGPRDKILEKRLLTSLKKKPSLSERDLAKKCGTSNAMVQRMKQRNSFKTHKKGKKPKRSKKQFNTAVTRAKLLYKRLCSLDDICILMDDETYVKKDFTTLPGDSFYTVQDGYDLSDDEKCVSMEKFGAKILVWQAICSCGERTQSYFTTGTINAKNYTEECLKKRIRPFIRKHRGSILFWPDLASAHYAKDTLEWLGNENIPYVIKEENPPNCPELRPIERYWALVKQKLRKDARPSTNDADFKKKWHKFSNRVTKKTVQDLMVSVKRKVREFSRQPLKK